MIFIIPAENLDSHTLFFHTPEAFQYICAMRFWGVLLFYCVMVPAVWATPLITEPAFITSYQKTINGNLGTTDLSASRAGNRILLQLHEAWWQILHHEEIEKNTKFIFKTHEHIEGRFPEPEKCDNFQLLIYASAALFAIRVEALNGNKISGARRYLRAMPYLKAILERAEQADELKLIAALYHFGMPEFLHQNRMLTPFFWSFPTADFEKGKIWLLECSTSKSTFVNTEARYFLFKFHNNLFKNKPEAAVYLKDLAQQYPGNKVLQSEWQTLQKSLPQKK